MDLKDIHNALVVPICALEEQIDNAETEVSATIECIAKVLRIILNNIEREMIKEKKWFFYIGGNEYERGTVTINFRRKNKIWYSNSWRYKIVWKSCEQFI